MRVLAFGLAALAAFVLAAGFANPRTTFGALQDSYLCLDGVDDYASAPDSTSLDLGDEDGEDFTIEGFFYVPDESNDANGLIFHKNSAYSLFINFNTSSADVVLFRFWSTATLSSTLSNTTNLTVGWYHIAAVFDNEWSPDNDRAAIYLNGVEFASTSTFELTLGIFNSTATLQVGGNFGASPLPGGLEETRLSDNVRYTANFAVPSEPFASDGNTRALWHFDEAAGSTSFADASGNGNTLTGANGAQICSTAPPDADGDGVPDDTDNCPNWPNPSQSLPPWPVPAGDPDCDGFSTDDEVIEDPFSSGIGTDPIDPCAETSISNDELADPHWPPDFDDNKVVNILDVVPILPPTFGQTGGPPDLAFQRKDIVPDGVINILDVIKVLPPFFGSVCS